MKKLFIIPLLFSILFLNVAGMCSDENERPSTVRVNNLIALASQGTWRITSFINNETNKTSNFTGYNFTFGANNLLTAVNNSITVPGYWLVFNSNNNVLTFTTTFDSPVNFADLNYDWEVASSTATTIKLQNISSTAGRSDYLTLEKNQ